jgi:hypothetical protein
MVKIATKARSKADKKTVTMYEAYFDHLAEAADLLIELTEDGINSEIVERIEKHHEREDKLFATDAQMWPPEEPS